jgi:hypothetical protein
MEKHPSVTYLQQPEVQAAVLKEVTNQYRPAINYPAQDDELWIRHFVHGAGRASGTAALRKRLEDYVSGLIDFDDVATKNMPICRWSHIFAATYPRTTPQILRLHQKENARFVHAQMQAAMRRSGALLASATGG